LRFESFGEELVDGLVEWVLSRLFFIFANCRSRKHGWMCTQDISNDLDGNVLKSFMSFREAMQEEREILLGEVLSVLSILHQ